MYFVMENGKFFLKEQITDETHVKVPLIVKGGNFEETVDQLIDVAKNCSPVPLDRFDFNDETLTKDNITEEFLVEFTKFVEQNITEQMEFIDNTYCCVGEVEVVSNLYINLKGALSKKCIGKPIMGLGSRDDKINNNEEVYFYNVTGFYTDPENIDISELILKDCNIEYCDFVEKIKRIVGNSCLVTFLDLIRITYGIVNIAVIPCNEIDGFDEKTGISILKDVLDQI